MKNCLTIKNKGVSLRYKIFKTYKMKLLVSENSKNYACSVVEIKEKFDIENADNICRVVVNGNNVVVPKTTEVGSKMLYFVSGTKLSADYCKNNNLYDKTEEN